MCTGTVLHGAVGPGVPFVHDAFKYIIIIVYI